MSWDQVVQGSCCACLVEFDFEAEIGLTPGDIRSTDSCALPFAGGYFPETTGYGIVSCGHGFERGTDSPRHVARQPHLGRSRRSL
jgi:hypothetical protein